MYMKRQPIGSMLSAWYGSERSQAEKLRFLPSARSIAEISETVLRRALPEGSFEFQQILEAWPQIAGAEIARRATPFRLDGRKLLLEIAHPAWLTHFRSPQVKKALLQKINDLFGRELCLDVVFLPAGRLRPNEIEGGKKPAG